MTVKRFLLLIVCLLSGLVMLLAVGYSQAEPVQEGSRCVEVVSTAPMVVKVGVVVNGQCSVSK